MKEGFIFKLELNQPEFNQLIQEYEREFEDIEESFRAENKDLEIIFPEELTSELPEEVQLLISEFHFCFKGGKPAAAVLLLRRILPLSIVRKFQRADKEEEIIDEDGEYNQTEKLLNKSQEFLDDNRPYNDMKSAKDLTDNTQHSYSFSPTMDDVYSAATQLRVFLGVLFSD